LRVNLSAVIRVKKMRKVTGDPMIFHETGKRLELFSNHP